MNDDVSEFLFGAVVYLFGLAFMAGGLYVIVRFVKWAWIDQGH